MSHRDHVPDLGAASGIATLDGGTKLTGSQLPLATEVLAGGLEVGTQAEVDAGVLDNKIVTPAKLAAFPTSPAASGLTYVKIDLAAATLTSTGVIPDNAIVRDVVLDVLTSYGGGVTIQAERSGDAAKEILATGDSNPNSVGAYVVPQVTDWGAVGAGTVTVTISGGAGTAVLYIGYVTPTDIT